MVEFLAEPKRLKSLITFMTITTLMAIHIRIFLVQEAPLFNMTLSISDSI